MSNPVNQLREIIGRLRAPGGCPWDMEQTPDSLIPSLVEEAYEVADAIKRDHPADIEEELGDLLINILMQAEIASEKDSFTLDSIATVASEKLVRRHPHVFGDSIAHDSGAVLNQWEEIKRAERASKGVTCEQGEVSLLDGIARAFPALVRAQKIQKKAAKAGFDWKRPEDVVVKIREEIVEVEEEMACRDGGRNTERLTEEIGDLLFAVVNLSRALSIDAESALQAATGKFSTRFRIMEGEVSSGRSFADLSLEEMNELWERAKRVGDRADDVSNDPTGRP
jgi:MazG family protein